MRHSGGRVAQLGEHLLCKQGVAGSIPATSTNQLIEPTRFAVSLQNLISRCGKKCAVPAAGDRKCNAWTLPHEHCNADWIRKKQVGVVVRSFRHVAAAVAELLQPDNLRRFREPGAALSNRAVFEIPDIRADLRANGTRFFRFGKLRDGSRNDPRCPEYLSREGFRVFKLPVRNTRSGAPEAGSLSLLTATSMRFLAHFHHNSVSKKTLGRGTSSKRRAVCRLETKDVI